MKLTKMSLVAALLIGSSAFALDNVQISGDANVFYQTADAGGDLFDKDTSSADVALNLNATADVMKNDLVSISAGAGYTVLTTLGLENNFVSNVWGGAHTLTTGTNANFNGNDSANTTYGGVKVENASWFNEAWVAVTTGNTTAKLGRMELDTPLAFTEKWTIEKNTFEAAVVINQDIPDTVLVGAFVGNGNGTEFFGQNAQSNTTATGHATGGVVNGNGEFTTFGSDGAYAAGVINNSFEPLTVQAWYYDVTQVVAAYWLQADYVSKAVPGLMAGAQYSAHKIDSTDSKLGLGTTGAAVEVESDVYAVMLGYEMEDMFTAKVSYSQVGKDFAAGFNTATDLNYAQSKLYTEAWWNYGKVTQADTQAYNVTVTSPVNGLFDLGVFYTFADQAEATGPNDVKELTLTAGKSYGPLDLTVAYINSDYGKVADSTNIVQVYATLNF